MSEEKKFNFYEPVSVTEQGEDKTPLKMALLAGLGLIAGFLTFLVANMLARVTIIMIIAFFSVGDYGYYAIFYGIFLVMTAVIFYFVRKAYHTWGHAKWARRVFYFAYFFLYILTALLYMLEIFVY